MSTGPVITPSERDLMSSERVARRLPQNLDPGDAFLHDGNWHIVTGLVHDPAAGVVKVAVNRLIGGPTSVTVPDTRHVMFLDGEGRPAPSL